MKKALLVWEMGGGLGHLTDLQNLSNILIKKNYVIEFAFKPVNYVDTQSLVKDSTAYVSPTLQAETQKGNSANFSDLLIRNGYGDKKQVTKAADKWKEIYEKSNPDLVIYNYSPLATVVGEQYSFKRIVQGTPFSVPCPNLDESANFAFPLFFPLPDRIAFNLLQGREERLFESLHHVNPHLHSLKEFFNGAVPLLTTLEELDFYSSFRPMGTQYFSKVPYLGDDKPDLSVSSEEFIFGYLKNSKSIIQTLLQLAEVETRQFIIFINNFVPPKEIQDCKNLTFLPTTVSNEDFIQYINTSSFVINNGGHGGTLDAIIKGKPVLSIPLHLENLLNTSMLIRTGLGDGVFGDGTIKKVYPRFIESFGEHKKKAVEICNKYKHNKNKIENLV